MVIFLQTCHATSIVWVSSKSREYVVIAGDSRGFPGKKGKKKISDSECKLIAFDDTLFFMSGDVVRDKSPGQVSGWDSGRTAREVFSESKDHDVEALSKEWTVRAMKWFSELGQVALTQIASFQEGGVVTGGFINIDSKRNVSEVDYSLNYDIQHHKLSPEKGDPSEGGVGVTGVEWGLVEEFKKRQTARARTAWGNLKPRNLGEDLSYDMEFARRAVQFVIDNASGENKKLVHGPIDVAVVSRLGGIDWHPRKPNCYSQDFHSSAEKSTGEKRPSH